MKNITIIGARIHNLKGIDVSIPKNKIVLVTGVSGSGKSSLVFDIIFEEGRKQYLQSLGVFAQIDKEKKFENISGIGPTVAVQQNIIRQSNPRSTVGSRTNILNIIEHDPEVLSACDWIIELGPDGGSEGGRIIAEGLPRILKNNPASITGSYLTIKK